MRGFFLTAVLSGWLVWMARKPGVMIPRARRDSLAIFRVGATGTVSSGTKGMRRRTVRKQEKRGVLHGYNVGHRLSRAMGTLPVRHHVDRAAVLLQLRPDRVLQRSGRTCTRRCVRETRTARALVLPLGRDVHVSDRSHHARDSWYEQHARHRNRSDAR